jgi:peptide subunit release factor 1 (eRF1)
MHGLETIKKINQAPVIDLICPVCRYAREWPTSSNKLQPSICPDCGSELEEVK